MAVSLRDIAHILSNRGRDVRIDGARIPARGRPSCLEPSLEYRARGYSCVLD